MEGGWPSRRNNRFTGPVIACVRPDVPSEIGVVLQLKAEREVREGRRGARNWIGQQFTCSILFDRSELPQHAIDMSVPVIALLIALAGPAAPTRVLPDSLPGQDTLLVQPIQPVEDSVSERIPSRLLLPVSLELPPDTTAPRRRRKAVQVSDWYERRLRIHRYLAYTTIPLYAFQAIAGNQLYQQSSGAPEWARTGHRVGATALAGVFTVNTVTGLWNLWDSRSVPQGRTRRTIHTLLMLASDAGFTYAGVRLSEQAENSLAKRRQHRNLAYASMGVAIAGSGMMLIWRD